MHFSLHKTPKSSFIYVAYRDGTGKRTLRSTGEINRSKARIKAEAMVAIAEAERRRETDKRFFDRLVSETLSRLGHSPSPEPMIFKWLEQWLADIQSTVSPTTHQKYSAVIEQFIRSLGDKKYKPLSDVNWEEVAKFRDQLLRSGLAPKTVNSSARVILKMPFRLAVDSGLCESTGHERLLPEFPRGRSQKVQCD
jgi:hypothetical protein